LLDIPPSVRTGYRFQRTEVRWGRRWLASATGEEKSNALSLRTIIRTRQEFAGFVLGMRGSLPGMNFLRRTVGEWLYRHANPDDFSPGSPKHLKLMAVLMTIALALLLPK